MSRQRILIYSAAGVVLVASLLAGLSAWTIFGANTPSFEGERTVTIPDRDFDAAVDSLRASGTASLRVVNPVPGDGDGRRFHLMERADQARPLRLLVGRFVLRPARHDPQGTADARPCHDSAGTSAWRYRGRHGAKARSARGSVSRRAPGHHARRVDGRQGRPPVRLHDARDVRVLLANARSGRH